MSKFQVNHLEGAKNIYKYRSLLQCLPKFHCRNICCQSVPHYQRLIPTFKDLQACSIISSSFLGAFFDCSAETSERHSDPAHFSAALLATSRSKTRPLTQEMKQTAAITEKVVENIFDNPMIPKINYAIQRCRLHNLTTHVMKFLFYSGDHMESL